jgi:hypothetical protein
MVSAGMVKIPPPSPAPTVKAPNFAKVRRLGRKARGVKEPLFLMPREDFPSYSDFWQLVRLSGFEIQYMDAAWLDDPNNICVFVTPEGIPDCQGKRAKTIFWQFEYAGDYTGQENWQTVDEVWASDPTWAKENGAKFVLLGGHLGLSLQPSQQNGVLRYDVVMLAYMIHRREALKNQLSDLRWPPIYPGHDGVQRHEVLSTSALMLHAHQTEPTMTPLRYALAAAYKLPFLGEQVPDSGIYGGALRFAPYEQLADLTRAALDDKQLLRVEGERLHQFLCVEHTFEREVRMALGEKPKNVNIVRRADPPVMAFTRLHYGADYLEYVLKSSEGFADKHLILYTEKPNFRPTELECPDGREELREIATRVAGDRLVWIEGVEVSPKSALELMPDMEVAVELDADEVIDPSLFEHILEQYKAGNLTVREYRLPFVHYWRSFGYVCRDRVWRVSLTLQRNPVGEPQYYPDEFGVIHHFGYARSLKDTRYKMDLSIHKEEFRPNWWEEVFLRFPERLTDLHPVVSDIWNAEPFDRQELPEILHGHPYFGLEVIE